MKPTLLVLAAGMGSRYGGLKQMDGLGPNQETIIDYDRETNYKVYGKSKKKQRYSGYYVQNVLNYSVI